MVLGNNRLRGSKSVVTIKIDVIGSSYFLSFLSCPGK